MSENEQKCILEIIETKVILTKRIEENVYADQENFVHWIKHLFKHCFF